jgi:parallel beta-helix repeat protein
MTVLSGACACRRRLRLSLLLAVFATIGAAVAAGAPTLAADSTLYVDRSNTSCSDSGPGTASQPFCTISAAAARVAAGQTVQVATGTYAEAVTIPTSGTSSAPITFTAGPGANVTLSGQSSGFTISGRSWITINGFNVTQTSAYGIALSSASHITISNNHVSFAGQPASGQTRAGIRLSNVSDSLVSSNTSDHNSDYGIVLTSGSTRNEVRGNQTFSNAEGYQRAAAGIRLYSSPSNTIDGNITHHNEDSGIECYTGSNNTLIYNNVSYNNGDHGIDDYQTTGQRVIANSVYKNVTAGINVEGSSTGATLANNIAVDNGINSPRTQGDIRVESGSTSGTTMNNDLVHLTSSGVLLIWNSVNYTSLSSFKSATGQESRGIQADPMWRNATAGDLHLTAGSPAIDSADSGVSGQPNTDVEGHARVDDPATANTGVGPRAYDDRGAYELSGSSDSPPAASLSVAVTGPLTVTADASASTDTDATPIASYTFDFGDGSAPVGPQAGATADHTYLAPGTYTVTVTVTDTAGLSSTASATAQVSLIDSPPAASLSLTPSSGRAPLAVTADASASTDNDGSPIETYRFDFGDGSPAVGPQTAATAQHTYTAAGTYTVTVTVTDTAGLSSTATSSVSVADSPPTASLTLQPASGKHPLTVTADASASSDPDSTPIASYSFDFGDGSAVVGPQSAPRATHTFVAGGTYYVTVTVTDTAGLSSTATRKIKVK